MYSEWKKGQAHTPSESSTSSETYFNRFDKGKKCHLDLSEFHDLIEDLFGREGKPGDADEKWIEDFFTVCDLDGDGKISKTEFERSWKSWIHDVLTPVTALVVVDVQNDFISGTLSLRSCPAQQKAEEVIPVINHMLDDVRFDVVVYTLDWHPPDHISFFENVKDRKFHPSSKVQQKDAKLFDEVVFNVNSKPVNQVLWPAHCIQETYGAQLHRDLNVLDNHVTVKKGLNPEVDSYSAFWDNGKLSQTKLHDELRKRNVTDVYMCGLAYDVCVAHTASHANEYGYRTIFIEDACRGVSQEGMDNIKRELTEKDVLFVQSNEVKDLAAGKTRPLSLGKVSMNNYKRSLRT